MKLSTLNQVKQIVKRREELGLLERSMKDRAFAQSTINECRIELTDELRAAVIVNLTDERNKIDARLRALGVEPNE